ncbi:nucleolar protein 12 [Hylaeus anthracinus]|uniref:nucleolar protein 12 n=1 Tax=Hylaeus anthracinus TaxID=313031 RepID=UPI0023B9F69A|nr:nucleolar protein 12 [Hylaeus anthracinus]
MTNRNACPKETRSRLAASRTIPLPIAHYRLSNRFPNACSSSPPLSLPIFRSQTPRPLSTLLAVHAVRGRTVLTDRNQNNNLYLTKVSRLSDMALRVKLQPKLLNVNRVPGKPKKRKKVTLVFDEKKRRDFLTGFHKRKVQRQKKAQEELKQQLKEERKRIKQNARERYKKLLSSRDIPEIQQLLSEQEFETEGHTVSVLELNVADFADKNVLIGENKGIGKVENKEEEEEEESDKNSEDEQIVGMTLKKRKTIEISEETKKSKQIDNEKDFKRTIKKAALQQVKKSKAFQQKQKLERQKNKKESMRKLKRVQKARKRSGKFRKK